MAAQTTPMPIGPRQAPHRNGCKWILEKVCAINFINVVTYWDGQRYYQWNAAVSVDGRNWKKVLDFSKNKVPATPNGYSGKFPKTDARCVRINMLKNSVNPFVHIVELIVGETK